MASRWFTILIMILGEQRLLVSYDLHTQTKFQAFVSVPFPKCSSQCMSTLSVQPFKQSRFPRMSPSSICPFMSLRLERHYDTLIPEWVDAVLLRELGPRLGTIASLVLPGSNVIDVGTDHGILAIALATSGRANRVIASDVHEEPLANCRRNLAAAEPPVQGRIDVRLGGGLSVLRPGEVDTVAVAGMGGEKVLDVLFGAPHSAEELGIRRAVVQPTSNVEDVRAALARRGWTITHEALTCTGRWAHIILAAEPPATGSATAAAGMTEEDVVLGPLLRWRPQCEAYRGWLRHQLGHYRRVESGAARAGRREAGDIEASRRACIIDAALRAA